MEGDFVFVGTVVGEDEDGAGFLDGMYVRVCVEDERVEVGKVVFCSVLF